MDPIKQQDADSHNRAENEANLRLCHLCQLIPTDILDLDEYGYAHHSSFAALRDSASGNSYCHLCQMLWESVVTKRQRFKGSKDKVDPLLTQKWPVKIYGVRNLTTDIEHDQDFFRGYEALEVRSGDFNAGLIPDSSWWSMPSGPFGTMYPVVSRLYLHPSKESKSGWVYTNVGLNDSSPASFQGARRWAAQCIETHNHTPVPRAESGLPSRVLDVGVSRDKVFLLEPSSNQMSRYTALSYCWGKSKALITTADNFQAHVHEGIRVELLPKTIRDAVIITRELDVRYLWVDALCIIQGRDEAPQADWQRECVKMAHIYGKAFVTIIAADSTDSNQGILVKRQLMPKNVELARDGITDRDPIPTAQRQVFVESKAFALNENHWSTRGWTLQEMVLSPRALIYQSQNTYWKCANGIVGSDVKVASLPRIKNISATAIQENWSKLVEEYMRRFLTVGTDKLPALSGLATLYYDNSKDKYLAGLWKGSLLGDLLWRTEGSSELLPNRPLPPRAPSWSWASIDGPIDYDLSDVDTNIDLSNTMKLLSSDITLAGIDPFGQVVSGILEIRGKMKLATSLTLDRCHTAGDIMDGNLKLARAYADEKRSWEDSEVVPGPLWCLLVAGRAGLLLRPTGRRRMEYVRIGIMVLYVKAGGLQKLLGSWETETLYVI